MDWYNGLEHGLLDASYDEYKFVEFLAAWLSFMYLGLTIAFSSYENQLKLSKSHLDSLLEDTSSTLSLLTSLSESFKAVQTQTTTFQQQCEGLLQEQKRMTHLALELEQNLKYYAYLEPATRRLNAPGAGSFVRSTEFSEMLSRLDDCLDYMKAHVCLWLLLTATHLTF